MKNTLACIAILAPGLAASCAVMRNTSSPGEYVDDSAISALVKARLASDPRANATALEVETLRRVVQLSGYAKSQTEKDRAGDLARDVEGVKEVRNDIIVDP
jgi:hyperosmotically inducible protein